uniref:CD164 molecule, sialomucin n=1 Tax=Mola mola TaxID=94237 RepID=A0A3Q3X5A8_MOLML
MFCPRVLSRTHSLTAAYSDIFQAHGPVFRPIIRLLKCFCGKIIFSFEPHFQLTASFIHPTDCSRAESCDLCVGDSMLNLTGCVWRLCPDGNSSLLLPPLGDGSKTNSSPKFSQAKFDMSSFIGGIILVLCVQAGGFFAMRFLKSKEQSSYDPM